MQEKQRIQFSGKVVTILKEQSMRREIAGLHGWNGIHKYAQLAGTFVVFPAFVATEIREGHAQGIPIIQRPEQL